MNRRKFVHGSLTCALAAQESISAQSRAGADTFELEEKNLDELGSLMQSGRYTSRRLTELYLARIEATNRKGPQLGAVIETDPDALAVADTLDRERKQKGARGPLHGIPLLIKDNVGTADRTHTSAGSLALADWTPPSDAFLIQRLRAAGAVILGKANMSEWAFWRSSRGVSGWSARGGQARNPYALDRNPSGSSGGSRRCRVWQSLRRGCGQRYRGLHHVPGVGERRCWNSPNFGIGQPGRRHSRFRNAGHRGSHGAHRARRGDSSGRDDRR